VGKWAHIHQLLIPNSLKAKYLWPFKSQNEELTS
jgi:hypothetical protein